MKDLRFFVMLYFPLCILNFQKTRILRKELFQSGRQTTQGCLYCTRMIQRLGSVCPRCPVTWQYFGTLILRPTQKYVVNLGLVLKIYGNVDVSCFGTHARADTQCLSEVIWEQCAWWQKKQKRGSRSAAGRNQQRGLTSQKTHLCGPQHLDKMHRLSQENKILQYNTYGVAPLNTRSFFGGGGSHSPWNVI